MEKFGKVDNSEKTIAILGDRGWPQTAKQEGDKTDGNGNAMLQSFLCILF